MVLGCHPDQEASLFSGQIYQYISGRQIRGKRNFRGEGAPTSCPWAPLSFQRALRVDRRGGWGECLPCPLPGSAYGKSWYALGLK